MSEDTKEELTNDMLRDSFNRQAVFMELLREADRMPEWPVDMTSKAGQRLVRETTLNMIEELMEAIFTLRNKMHRITDVRVLDFEHYVEELGDAYAFFIEICHLSGISPEMLHTEYCRKNAVVKERLVKGY
jgi:hypothetical protein